MKINAEVKQVKNFKDYFFVVPDYQREYVWEKEKNVERFLQDINDEFSPNAREQNNYFIGSTIIVKRKDGKFDVIDGQQRLTTIIITLCTMREKLGVLDTSNLQDVDKQEHLQLLRITDELLYEYSLQDRRNTPRLELQYSDSKDYLLKLIERNEFTDRDTNSIRRMKDASSAVSEFLHEFDPTTLLSFIRYFLMNVEMVMIQPDDIGSALKIFETINERGVGLNAMDLLKNLLFINARPDEFDQIKIIWKSVVGHLQECGEGDKPLRFLRYFFIARYHNGVIREEEIYKWIISNDGKSSIQYDQHPVRFANEILKAAEKYHAFLKAANSDNADLRYPYVTGISYLSRNARQPFILLLALKDSLNDFTINLLAKNLEALLFYYATNKVLTKYYEGLFASLAIKLRKLSSEDELKTFIETELSPIIDIQRNQFASSFDSKTEFDIVPQYRIKYIFGRIEEFIRSRVHLPSNDLAFYQKHQIEHILPQAGINIPADQYPEPYSYNNAVHKVGNLTLLESPINASLNFSRDISTNDWFLSKKSAYENSNTILTKSINAYRIGQNTAYNQFAGDYLKEYTIWNGDTILDRQHILRDLMLEAWKSDTN